MMRWGETDYRVAALLAMTEHGSRKIHPQQIPAPPLPVLLGAEEQIMSTAAVPSNILRDILGE